MIKRIINFSLPGLVFLLPLFFLPLTADFYQVPKNFLLILVSVTLFCLWTAEKILSGELLTRLHLVKTSFDLPVLLFCLANLLPMLISSPNKVEALLTPGGTGTIIALTLLYFVLAHAHVTGLHPVKGATFASATFLALLSLYQFFGVGESIAPFDFMKQKSWTPAGGLLPLATFLGVGLTVGVTRFLFRKKNNDQRELVSLSKNNRLKSVTPSSEMTKFISLTSIIAITLGLLITIYQLLVTDRPFLLPQTIGWQIGIDAFKRSPLFGVGPGNFITAFTRFKPPEYNQTQFWNFRFATSSNFYFQLLTEVGLLGLAAYLFLIYRVMVTWLHGYMVNNRTIEQLNNLAIIPLLSIFALQLFLPSNLLLLFTLFVLLGVCASYSKKGAEEKKEDLRLYLEDTQKKLRSVKALVLAPLLFELIFLFFLAKIVWAEVLYKKALDKASQGRGGQAYNLLISAIRKNPYLDNYRISYSQINLALANTLAGKAGLTDQDRANISQLIQQAIREAKAAVALNPLKVSSWENLARIYRSLINFAQGADSWTMASYNQAISLDPLNPILRVDLGGVFYALGNYDEAEKVFKQAILLKPDFANAHYNLAAALKEKGQLGGALREMQITLSLVEPGTNDFQKVSQELEDLRAKLPSPEAPVATPSGALETLSPPATAPAGIKPPLELGEEVEPEITPSPTPSPTLTITPEITPTP